MDKCTIVLLGATGDLAKRKLIPALYTLVANGKLKDFLFVGAAFEDVTVDEMLDQSLPFIEKGKIKSWELLKKRTVYQQLDFSYEEGFEYLTKLIEKLEKQYNLTGNRLVYCATSSDFFCLITKHLVKAGIIQKKKQEEKSWNRIIYEKPFGYDVASAHKINKCIAQLLYEHQIFRIDHYLTKELVSNIALVRFTNCVFEPLWNNRFIDNVQIILSEKICVEGRGIYYDKYGAILDVMQNHMLELLALIAMEMPKRLTGEFIRQERAKVLKDVNAVDLCMGQYEGYRESQGVDPESNTETFAMAYLRINNPRWSGVPFYLKTGKCLDKKETVIYMKFKKVECLLTKGCPQESNYLTIQIAPDAGFSLSLNVKKPGRLYEVVPVDMEFYHSCLWEEKSAEAYEVLFEEVIHGEQSVSVRFDEIEYAWKVIDELKKIDVPVYPYEPGSIGPFECDIFAKKHGMRWLS